MKTYSNNPEYAEVNGKKYKINTDFRIAIECQRIAEDNSIGDFQRAMGIIYKLYGDEAIDSKNMNDWSRLLELAIQFLTLGNEQTNSISNDEPDMDLIEDMPYIEASFMSDYKIDITNEKIHWWKFYKLLEGLSNSEIGNCCILNRIRNLRTTDTSKIKDIKERDRINEAKKQYALKKKNKIILTKEQEENRIALLKNIGIIE